MWEKTGHKIDWEGTEVLYKERNFIKRKFKEGIAIKKHKLDRLMNKKEEIKVIADMWEELLIR